MILDLHVHSYHSLDSPARPTDIIRTAKKRGLHGVAVTDHGTIRGGVETLEANTDPHFVVIVGAEYSTDAGDITGLFLEEEITSHRSIEVVDQIHDQGGIALLPHPFKGHCLDDELLRGIDVIEHFNARTSAEKNRQALKLAQRLSKPVIAGSDAHFTTEIGTCRVHVHGADIKAALLRGDVELKTAYSPLYIQYVSQMVKSVKTGHYQFLPWQFLTVVKKMIVGR